jgi:hypothetical protein
MSKQGKKRAKVDRRRLAAARRWFRPALEILEDRLLLSASWPAWLVAQPAGSGIVTLNAAQALNFSANPSNGTPALAAGTSGAVVNQGAAGGVNWYQFTLTQASEVQVSTLDAAAGTHLDAVLSLYDTEATDPYYPLSFTAPPYDSQQHRLLAQADEAPGAAPVSLSRELAPGTYYVAVSGDGDAYFNPFLAGSGYAGSTGSYRLLVTATPLPLVPTDGPAVLAVDPGLSTTPNSIPVLSSSPLAVFVDFTSPIDPTSVTLLQPGGPTSPPPTVQLTYNPTGQFGDGSDSPVYLTGFHYASDAQELQLQAAAPLAPGYYQLTLAGDPGTASNPVITDPTDTLNLGEDAAHPDGQDFTTTFEVAGSATSHDTSGAAYNLGDVTTSGLVQQTGVIGNDPAYNPSLPQATAAPYLNNPASQVNLYHFQVSGPGSYDLEAEVFAGRIGSTLDAAVSLFRVVTTGAGASLQFVASNDNSNNESLSSNGNSLPLFTDPLLNVGLTAGDYYLAVSASGNVPDAVTPPGTGGVFDPNVSHSGYNGFSTGPYVLNLLVQPAAPAPHVVSTSIPAGATLAAPPTQLTVTFDSPVDVSALANQAFDATSQTTVSGVYFTGPDGQRYFPRLESYNEVTNQATFLLLDRLPNGVNQLHLSGAAGLTGYGGAPLVGNDPSGDYVVSFSVEDPDAPANPLARTGPAAGADPAGVEDLGVLFPHELQDGVSVAGAVPAAAGGSETYTFQVLEFQEYQFTLNGPPSFSGGFETQPGNVQMALTDAAGLPVSTLQGNDPNALFATLQPGSYTITVSRSTGDDSLAVPYDVHVTMLYQHENPPPLSIGATPVLQIRLAGGLSTSPADLGAGPAAGDASPTGSGVFPSDSSLNQVALSLRADPVGGVTGDAGGTLVASTPPAQVQGLSNATASAAGYRLSPGAILAALLVSPLESGADPVSDKLPPSAEAVWSSWKEWLGSCPRWLGSLPGVELPSADVPPLARGEGAPLQAQPSQTGKLWLADRATAPRQVVPPAQVAAAPAPALPTQAEEAPAGVGAETGGSPAGGGFTSWLTWAGTLLGAAVAAVVVWWKPFTSRIPPVPPVRPPLELRPGSLDAGRTKTVVIPQ